METIADFRIHSRYAMACSKNIAIHGFNAGARQKGIKVIGIGDFMHPLWPKEIKGNLANAGQGLLLSRAQAPNTFHIERGGLNSF